MYHDSMYNDTLFVGADSFLITISIFDTSKTKMTLSGLCSNGTTFYLTGLPGFQATVDTIVGDTATYNQGQIFCTSGDTLSGYITKDRVDSPAVLHFYLQVATDSTVITHNGSAVLKP